MTEIHTAPIRARKQLLHLGNERQPLLIIDDAAPDPMALVAGAEDGNAFRHAGDNFYPGHRKAAPPGYSHLLQQFAADIAEVFGTPTSAGVARLAIDTSVYSLVTMPENALRPIQCVPHIDSQDPSHIAAVHYLCDEKYGGTSFYRHRSSGYESITEKCCTAYFRELKAEVMRQGLAALHYMNGSTPLFDRVHCVPLKFNRLILYRGNCLHAGDIDPTLGLPLSPRQGRLTINSFLRVENRNPR